MRLPDGSEVPRLPGYRRWITRGAEFCGTIGFRWQPGTAALPAHVLGHIGYAVVPWMRCRGYATAALALLLAELRAAGELPYVELTTDPGNLASQAVIRANGGLPAGEFTKGAAYGGAKGLRWRIPLAPASAAGPEAWAGSATGSATANPPGF